MGVMSTRREVQDARKALEDVFEITPEIEAELERAIQDMNDGFSYLMLEDNEIQCNKCKRVGKLLEHPFPHKLNCPMKRY
jgi:hypothetical protein